MANKYKAINPRQAEHINAWLKTVNLTQARLGELIGYTRQYMNLVCKGKRPISMRMAQMISDKTECDGKKVNVLYLIGLDDEMYEEKRPELSPLQKWHIKDPEEEGYYLCTVDFTGGCPETHEYYFENGGWYLDANCVGAENNGFYADVDPDECIKAWMPLPDPFRGWKSV